MGRDGDELAPATTRSTPRSARTGTPSDSNVLRRRMVFSTFGAAATTRLGTATAPIATKPPGNEYARWPLDDFPASAVWVRRGAPVASAACSEPQLRRHRNGYHRRETRPHTPSVDGRAVAVDNGAGTGPGARRTHLAPAVVFGRDVATVVQLTGASGIDVMLQQPRPADAGVDDGAKAST